MRAPAIDRVLVEAAPGEARAVAFAGDEAWEIAVDRSAEGPGEGDIYRARAGALGPDGGRFFDLGDGGSGLARRARDDWTEGAYGLVQVLRGEAGDKGPRVTDRVWLNQGGVAVAIGAEGKTADRVEIARALPKAIRAELRDRLEESLPKAAAVRVSAVPAGEIEADVRSMAKFLTGLARADGPPRLLHQAPGEIERLAVRAPGAQWAAADLATTVWAGAFGVTFETPDPAVAAEIDAAVAAALEVETPIPGGGRLWIEPTRALTAIDVDSGPMEHGPANVAAAQEIARQLRVRRIGGVVAVDFLKSGLPTALEALAGLAPADPWPWRAPMGADASGIVSFQRERRGESLAALNAGPRAAALRALRLAARRGRDGAAAIAAPGAVIDLLHGPLRPAVDEADRRLGLALDLRRDPALGSPRILDRNGGILDEA